MLNFDLNLVPKTLPTSIEQPPVTKCPTLACEVCKLKHALSGTTVAIMPTPHQYVGRYTVMSNIPGAVPRVMFHQFIYECCRCSNHRVFGTADK